MFGNYLISLTVTFNMKKLLLELFGIGLTRKPRWIAIDANDFTAYFFSISILLTLTIVGGNYQAIAEINRHYHQQHVWAWNTILEVAKEAEDEHLDDLFLREYENGTLPASSFNGHVERDSVIAYASARLKELE
jgi:hypothetical protein